MKVDTLDVLTDVEESKALIATCTRPNSELVLRLEEVDRPQDEMEEDRLGCSTLRLHYKPEACEAKEISILGWDIGALLDGIDKLRPEIEARWPK